MARHGGWHRLAACVREGVDFKETPDLRNEKEVRRNKQICLTCPVRPECFAEAYFSEIPDGTLIAGTLSRSDRNLFVAMLQLPTPVTKDVLILGIRRINGT